MLDSVLEFFGAGSDREQWIDELEAMDDHELADLGIVRDQIEAFVDARLPAEE